jgi:hypothetical protein
MNIAARPVRSLTVVPDYREQSYRIALELQSRLQHEINARFSFRPSRPNFSGC